MIPFLLFKFIVLPSSFLHQNQKILYLLPEMIIDDQINLITSFHKSFLVRENKAERQTINIHNKRR